MISVTLHQPVVDNTDLTGHYDFSLVWTPSPNESWLSMVSPEIRAQLPIAPPIADGPSIFVALEEQLGLKLTPTKVPVEVFVIDSVQKLSDN
jgi:uncharacterized protein (TIGR03435 family)